MVAGSILPVTIHNGKLYFLFGKENPFEDSAKGWSDFGGGCENNETPYETALREGGEELTGFLGDDKNIRKLIKKGGGIHHIEHNEYHVHIFYLPYDENLPKYYNQNHKFLWERMDTKLLSKTKLFEKIEIHWFSETELRTRRSQFRSFYREIVDKIIDDFENIRRFIHKKTVRKTRKNKRG
jgi:8-oxo-dGTP pyrophosphatase MutT (NUDIX family)